MTAPALVQPGWLRTLVVYAGLESKILWRARHVLVFIVLFPAVLAAVLGPAVSGLHGEAALGRTVIGLGTMFAYMVVGYTGQALYREFWYGTWLRHATLRPSPLGYVLGKALPCAVIALLQLGTFFTIAVLALGLPLHGHPLQLAAIAASLIASAVALGFCLFSLTSTWDSMASVAYLVFVSSSAVGGAIVSWSQLPPWSRYAGYLSPHFWALQAIEECTTGTGSWSLVLRSIGVLLFLTALFAALGASRFDVRARK